MTVSSTTNRKSFTGDAVTTSFGTSPVIFFNTSELVVQVVTTATGAATTLTENTHYTVSGGSGSTGTVNLSGGSSPYGAPSAAQTLVILRVLPFTQADDFVNNDINDAEVLEDRLDKITMLLQQLDEVDDRSLKLSSAETASAALTELPFDRASKFLAFDASKNLIAAAGTTETPVSAFMATVLDDANAAAARTTLGAAPTASPTFTGVASFPDGTAAAPSVKVGDEQNGLYSPAANQLGFAVAGGGAAVLSTTGLGIGVTPGQKLDVGGVVTIRASAAPTYDSNTFLWSESGVGVNIDAFNIKFNTGPSSRTLGLMVDSSQRVILAGTSPGTGFTNGGDITTAATNAIKSRSTFSAWVRHNNAGTITRALNVGSVTKNSTGNYTANITASVMADGGYGFVATTGSNTELSIVHNSGAAITATAFPYLTTTSVGVTDPLGDTTVGFLP